MFLGTSATARALQRLSKTWRIKARVQAGLSWHVVSEQWEVSGALQRSSCFHSLKGPSDIWHMTALVIKVCWDHSRLQAKPIYISQWCGSFSWWWQKGDPNQVTILSVKGKAIPVLWSSWSISSVVIMGVLSKSWTSLMWCEPKGASCYDGIVWTQLCCWGCWERTASLGRRIMGETSESALQSFLLKQQRQNALVSSQPSEGNIWGKGLSPHHTLGLP